MRWHVYVFYDQAAAAGPAQAHDAPIILDLDFGRRNKETSLVSDLAVFV